jgi:hypothetical protein
MSGTNEPVDVAHFSFLNAFVFIEEVFRTSVLFTEGHTMIEPHDSPPWADLSAEERAAAFARLLETGDYRSLFGRHIDSIFHQASNQLAESGLGDEIGALRYVLARLIAEQKDLDRLAINVARIVSVTIKAAQMQQDLTGQAADAFAEELRQVLDQVGIPPAIEAKSTTLPAQEELP